jgi:hypothetical protein
LASADTTVLGASGPGRNRRSKQEEDAMAKSQRTTFAKLQRDRARQAKQAEKRERRRAKRDDEELGDPGAAAQTDDNDVAGADVKDLAPPDA